MNYNFKKYKEYIKYFKYSTIKYDFSNKILYLPMKSF